MQNHFSKDITWTWVPCELMISTEDITSSNTRATRLQLSVRVCARERAVDVSVGAHVVGRHERIVCVKGVQGYRERC